MDVELSNVLPSLRDVEGVFASFVVSDQGDVVARDLSSFVEDASLAEVAPRLGRFHEAMSSNGDFLDLFVLEYSDQALHARRLPNGFLCLITSHDVNAPSLRMAINLVARKVGDRIGRHKASEPTTPTPTTSPTMRTTPPPIPTMTTSRVTPPPLPRQTPVAGLARTTSTRPVVAEPAAEPEVKPVRYYRGRAVSD